MSEAAPTNTAHQYSRTVGPPPNIGEASSTPVTASGTHKTISKTASAHAQRMLVVVR